MLSPADLAAFWITIKLAAVTTVLLLVIATPLAWWLARTKWRFRYVIEAMVSLPLVLPPTVIGFYLLLALGPDGPLGMMAVAVTGRPLAFTFTGLVLGSVIYSFPFVVQPLHNSFQTIGKRPAEVAATLRASPMDSFWSVIVPMARPGFVTATVLGFAHTLGEFGVVLMIGGNIPGETQVLSIAIYDHVESLAYANAHVLAGTLVGVSLIVLTLLYALNGRVSVLKA